MPTTLRVCAIFQRRHLLHLKRPIRMLPQGEGCGHCVARLSRRSCLITSPVVPPFCHHLEISRSQLWVQPTIYSAMGRCCLWPCLVMHMDKLACSPALSAGGSFLPPMDAGCVAPFTNGAHPLTLPISL